jgi:hypothetical protein
VTNLRESMSRLLEDEPAAPMIADQIVADARKTQRRRRYVTGAAFAGTVAVAVAGVAVAASSTGTNHNGAQIVIASSSSPSASPGNDTTPMAISIIGTNSGNVRTEVPQCPSGQLPNLKVDHDQSVNPNAAVHALSPGALKVIDYGEPSNDYQPADHFLVDGAAPPTASVWVLAWNAAGPAQLSVLSTNAGAGDPFGTSGYNASYVGCLPDPD